MALGVVLAASAPKQSGFILGDIKEHWWKVLIVWSLPLALMLLDDSSSADNPFNGESCTMWLISPITQDLIFIGFI